MKAYIFTAKSKAAEIPLVLLELMNDASRTGAKNIAHTFGKRSPDSADLDSDDYGGSWTLHYRYPKGGQTRWAVSIAIHPTTPYAYRLRLKQPPAGVTMLETSSQNAESDWRSGKI